VIYLLWQIYLIFAFFYGCLTYLTYKQRKNLEKLKEGIMGEPLINYKEPHQIGKYISGKGLFTTLSKPIEDILLIEILSFSGTIIAFMIDLLMSFS